MKTIIEMARKYAVGGLEFDVEGLERFVNDVRADEREACAKVCESMRTYIDRHNAVIQSSATECATAIRARGNT
jgi:hypothetical protein